MNEMYERNLPECLANDLAARKKGVEENSRLLDCLWGEFYGSINIAEINDVAITHDQAQYLRDKYLWGRMCDTPLLTDLQCRFYKLYIAARHEALFCLFC